MLCIKNGLLAFRNRIHWHRLYDTKQNYSCLLSGHFIASNHGLKQKDKQEIIHRFRTPAPPLSLALRVKWEGPVSLLLLVEESHVRSCRFIDRNEWKKIARYYLNTICIVSSSRFIFVKLAKSPTMNCFQFKFSLMLE
jgi:hypothetical protein